MKEKRYFTSEQANLMIPMLEDAFHRMLQLQAQVRPLYDRLDRAGFAPIAEDFCISPVGAPMHIVHELATLKALLLALRDQLDALRGQGCVVKGIQPPLVDWYSTYDGEEVLLCWRLGEKSVAHYHPVENGFAARKPLRSDD